MQLEAAGVPTVVVATTAFAGLTRAVAERERLPEARTVVVAHPLGGIDADAVRSLAAAAVEDTLAALAR